MKLLEEKIRKEGKILPGDVLKIDSFLNHQIDVSFIDEIGREFYNLFKDQKINKILTIEASGISMAIATAKLFNNCPVVYAKKGGASNMSDSVYTSVAHSYTRNYDYYATVSKEYLNSNDNVLIVDDFLATGQATLALIDLCKQANAKVCGVGCVVEKLYQNGSKLLKEKGIHVETLAKVKSMNPDNGTIEFE